MPLDLTRPVQTRDGRKVRILCTDLKSFYPLVAAITNEDGTETVVTRHPDGRCHSSRRIMDADIVNSFEGAP